LQELDGKKGEVLFKIDPTTFEAAVGNLKAGLELAETRLAQSKELVKRQAGSAYDVEQYEAQVKQYKEQLRSAEWNLAETVVRAPADGYVIGLTLQPGQRVSNLPLRAWVAYVVDEDKLVVGINQNQIRHVRPGMPAEVTLKQFPGKTFAAEVDFISPMTGQGQLPPSGVVPTPTGQTPGPFGVILALADDRISMKEILGGSTGSAAIYTERLKMTHIVRRVTLRVEAWANYVNPF
jgi:multidrug resistance efflux pump